MFDIGWSELLVIAIVLIVVVGPKDLPPMIRAFGKTMAGLRKMAGEFRSQFDEALREAEMDDVRKTVSEVRDLNPAASLREAMNPLRQLGADIRADLAKATAAKTPDPAEGGAAADTPLTDRLAAALERVGLPESGMALAAAPPVVAAGAPAAAASVPATAAAAKQPDSVLPAAPDAAPAAAKTGRRAAAKPAQALSGEPVEPAAAAKKPAARKPATKTAGTKVAGVKTVAAAKRPARAKAAAATPAEPGENAMPEVARKDEA